MHESDEVLTFRDEPHCAPQRRGPRASLFLPFDVSDGRYEEVTSRIV